MNTEKNDETYWKPTLKEQLTFAFGGWLIDSAARLFLHTMRKIHVNGEVPFKKNKSKEAFILAIWHENGFLSPRILKPFKLYPMISASKDGELAARFVSRPGHVCIRGSTNRYARRALKKLIKMGKEGKKNLVIPPDGPKGPYRCVQDGVVGLAQLTGLPIIPFHYNASRQWQLPEKAWDRHKFPKPFATLVIGWGDPIDVPRQMTPAEFTAKIQEVEEAMLANARMTEEVSAHIAKGA